MGLNIKNPRTERLVAELAALAGEGKTEAITVAVEERLQRLQRRKGKRLETMKAIVHGMAPLLRDMPDIDSYLYDAKTGLPK